MMLGGGCSAVLACYGIERCGDAKPMPGLIFARRACHRSARSAASALNLLRFPQPGQGRRPPRPPTEANGCRASSGADWPSGSGAIIADGGFAHNDRLPPERSLSGELGVSRAELRKALAALEADGLIWRHVGRGTFIGARPVHNLDDVAFLGQLANPAQVLDARVAIEPELARLAALHAIRADLEAIRICCHRGRAAADWRELRGLGQQASTMRSPRRRTTSC